MSLEQDQPGTESPLRRSLQQSQVFSRSKYLRTFLFEPEAGSPLNQTSSSEPTLPAQSGLEDGDFRVSGTESAKNQLTLTLNPEKQLTPLVPIPPASLEHDSDDSTSSQETPSKPPAKRPSATVQMPTQAVTHHETSNVEASGDERKTTPEKTQKKAVDNKRLKPITHSSLVKPPREIKPAIIRDGVSEHAIKPTVARFEKKMAEGKGFTYNKTDSSNVKYNWEVDWGTPLPQTERISRALAAELKERGIKTDRQYANFWYNLTMKYSKLAGSPVPLFTAKKKALEDVVEEALQNEKRRKRQARKAEKKKQKQEKKKQPQGVEALLQCGADKTDDKTDEESNSDESVDMEALVAKMKADEEKQRMLTGVGTSCGYLKK